MNFGGHQNICNRRHTPIIYSTAETLSVLFEAWLFVNSGKASTKFEIDWCREEDDGGSIWSDLNH